MENNFLEIVQIVKQSRTNAIKVVNAELINLYRNVGMYIGEKIKQAEWGENTIGKLAVFIQNNHSQLKSFKPITLSYRADASGNKSYTKSCILFNCRVSSHFAD